MSETNLQTQTPVIGWEYTTIPFSISRLNAMAKQGWRLVAVVDVRPPEQQMILERALPGVTL
jgi:hypothetical protein